MRIIGNKLHYMLERPDSLKFNNMGDGYLRKSLKLANQQETLRCFITTIKGSSETTREATFNFASFYTRLLPGSRKPTVDFLEWFVGFTDACGNFIRSKDNFFFSIEDTDIKSLYTIKKELGFGKVSIFENSAKYIVADEHNMLKLIAILNGNLLLAKSNLSFHKWLLDFAVRFPKEEITYINERAVLLNLLNNFWLSGFITVTGRFFSSVIRTAEGNFIFKAGFSIIAERKILQAIKQSIGYGEIILNDDDAVFTIDTPDGIKEILFYLDRHKIYHYTRYIAYFQWRKYINAVQILNLGNRKVNIHKLLRLANSINKSKVEDIVRL